MYSTKGQRIMVIGYGSSPSICHLPWTPEEVWIDSAVSGTRFVVKNGSQTTTFPWYAVILDGPAGVGEVDSAKIRQVKIDYNERVEDARRAVWAAEAAYKKLAS